MGYVNMNPWKVLGVHRATPTEEVKLRYRDLMRIHHPDVGGTQQQAADITEAYNILVKPALLKSHVDTLTVLGTPCPKCGGKGYSYKQKGLTQRVTTPCDCCGGRGLLLKDGL